MAANEGTNVVDENVLLSHLRQAMKFNIEAELYTDATFFADKIVNLVSQTIGNQNNNVGTTGLSEHSKSSVSEATAQAVYDLGKSCYHYSIALDIQTITFSKLLLAQQRVLTMLRAIGKK